MCDGLGVVPLAGQLDRLVEDRADLVDLVHVVDALQQRRHPLEAHAGVDVLLRQRTDDVEVFLRAERTHLVLHEDVVPELHVAVFVDLGAALAPVFRAAVVVDLGARAGRAGNAHRPVVVGLAPAHDALQRHAGAAPDVDRLVVVEVDGRPQPLRVEPVAAVVDRVRRQLPGELDRLFLEVVAEREVAVHLEERAVPAGLADLVDVGRAQALLHADGSRKRRGSLTQEVRDELDHAGVDEQQIRVINRRQGCARHHRVSVRLEVGQEPSLHFRGSHQR